MIRDAPLCDLRQLIIAVVENHKLNITEEVLCGVLIWTPFRKADVTYSQFAKQAPGHLRLDRVCRISIERRPKFTSWQAAT
jgi:hypothetical protein